MSTARPFDVAVVGACGHVGLPLALAFADRGLRTVAYDINDVVVKHVMTGAMPFREDGAAEMLDRTLAAGTFSASTDLSRTREWPSGAES